MRLQKWFPQYETLGDQWRARLLRAILSLAIPLTIGLIIVSLIDATGLPLDAMACSVALLFEIAVWLLWIKRGLNLAATVFVTGSILISSAYIFLSGGITSPVLGVQIFVLVMAALITTSRFTLAAVVVLGTFDVLLLVLGSRQQLPQAILSGSPVIRLSFQIAFLLISLGTILYSNRIIKALTQNLANSEYRFRALFEKTSDAVFITGLDLNLLEVNKQAAKMLSYEPKELIGLPVKKLFPADEWKQVKERFETVKKDEFLEPTMRRFVAKTGKELILETNLSLVQDSGGNPLHYQSTGRDVTHKVQEERRLQLKASTDSLTGVLNRETILQHAEAELERAVREQQPLGLMLVDMDELKKINDTYGHLAGDQALITVAEVINAHKRRYDLVGRLGGDEFMIVLPGATTADAQAISRRMQGEISRRSVQTDKGAVPLSCAFGVASTDDQVSKIRSVNELIELADRSLYKAKREEK
ncbi:MAG TPA: sensor domain-containing diguanylate cyclase [Anaerolineales bacterium]|nr:sensor domain-containing diguanylate cyclase [Anaerolineales bacterium]